MEFGIGGTASGSQRQVTKMDMWRSSDEFAATFAMSISMGANQLMHPKDVLYQHTHKMYLGISLTKGTDRPGELDAPRALTSGALVPHDPPDQIVQQPQSKRHTCTASD